MLVCVPNPFAKLEAENVHPMSRRLLHRKQKKLGANLRVQLAEIDIVPAAACLRIPKALITDGGIVSVPISKLIRERAVCAPKYRSAGLLTPLVSFRF